MTQKNGSWGLYAGQRALFGLLNLLSGCSLLLKLWRLAERRMKMVSELVVYAQRKSNRRSNIVVLVAVVTELAFNFLPQSVAIVASKVYWL